jgi:hypothetical protein
MESHTSSSRDSVMSVAPIVTTSPSSVFLTVTVPFMGALMLQSETAFSA